MIPSLNEIFFLLTTLFGLHTPIFSERSAVTLDLENKRGSIEFFELKTTERALFLAKEGLIELESSRDFTEGFEMITLDSIVTSQHKEHLNVCLFFTIEDELALLSQLRFNKNVYGDHSGSKSLQYCLLPLEVLLSTNAREIIGHDIPILEWNKNEKNIQLEIGHTADIDEFWGKTVPIRLN